MKAPKACIASIGESSADLLAIYGFSDVDNLRDEFSTDRNVKAFNRRKSFSIDSLSKKTFSNLMSETRKRERIESVIAESFTTGDGKRAVLSVFDIKTRKWNADDQQVLKFLVGQIAISLEKAELLHDAEYRAHNFETLYTVSGDIASRRDIGNVLDLIVKSILHLFNAQCAFVYLYDKTQDDLVLTIIHGVDIEPGLRIKIGEGLAGRVAKTRKPKS